MRAKALWLASQAPLPPLPIKRRGFRALKGYSCDYIVEWNWVQGHDGNSENERADKLAYQAARGGY
jgi:ribonuclease HI